MTSRKIINELFMSTKSKKEHMTNLIRILTPDIAPILKEFTMNPLRINTDYFANSCELFWSLYEFFKYCFCCLGTRIPRIVGVQNYLNNYFAMYIRLTLANMRESCIFRLLGIRNYLNNYFAMYKHLTRSRVHVELESFAYLGIGIIKIIILLCILVWRARIYAYISHPPPTWG